MSKKKGLGYSSLTDKVYYGMQSKNMWVGEKKDVTNDFIAVAHEFFEENFIRNITSDDSDSLFIHIKNTPDAMERLASNLTKRANEIRKGEMWDEAVKEQLESKEPKA